MTNSQTRIELFKAIQAMRSAFMDEAMEKLSELREADTNYMNERYDEEALISLLEGHLHPRFEVEDIAFTIESLGLSLPTTGLPVLELACFVEVHEALRFEKLHMLLDVFDHVIQVAGYGSL